MGARRTSFDAIGTHWDITVTDSPSDIEWEQLLKQIRHKIEVFDRSYSRFRADSLVTRLSQQAGTYDLPADGYKLLRFYEQLYKVTAGKVTPLIGQVMVDAGYDANYSFETKQLKQPFTWEDVIELSSTKLTIKQPALLDFGAAGKGYLVDLVSAILDNAELHTYIINAGGDILHRSPSNNALAIGLENPLDTNEAVGVAHILNQSLCASSGSKRAWGTFHHIIDPVLLRSPTRIIATWVIASDTMTADGLATALFFTDPMELREMYKFSFAVLHDDMTLYRSQDFPAELFEGDIDGDNYEKN